MWRWILRMRWALQHLPPPWRRAMSFPMDRSSPLAMKGSAALRHSSSHPSSVISHFTFFTSLSNDGFRALWYKCIDLHLLLGMESAGIHEPLTTASWNATLTSVRTCTPTTCCLVVPPCTLALQTGCRRRSLLWPPAPWKSRSAQADYVYLIGSLISTITVSHLTRVIVN